MKMIIIDLIFDYFTFEDLEKMACVWKLFWYVATLDKLCDKYSKQRKKKSEKVALVRRVKDHQIILVKINDM
jgi:hypothetical protein